MLDVEAAHERGIDPLDRDDRQSDHRIAIGLMSS
jgi:hypothetical protein